MRAWLVVTVAIGAFAPVGASAQGVEPSPEEAEESSPYQRHMRNGVRLYRDGDYDGAIAEFEAAYRAEAKASPLINLALAYKKLQDPARAVEVLEKALRLHRDTMPDDQIEAAEREIRDMKALIAYVPVVLKPADARLTVDGRPVASVDKPLALSPGTRTFRAEAAGYRTLERAVRVVSGNDNAIVELALEPTVGEIVVTAKSESAWIEVDGKQRAQGSWRGTLPPGLHIVRVVEGDEAERVEVVVQAGAIHNVRQDDEGDLISDAAIPRDESDDPDARPFGPREIPDILRGVYLMGGGALLTASAIDPSRSVAFQPDGADRFGGAVSLHAGYRVADWAGFELYGQFSDIRVNGTVSDVDVLLENGSIGPGTAEEVTMILTSVRFGALMRILIPGRSRFRFVSTFGGGGAYEILRFHQSGESVIQGNTVYDAVEETGVGVWVTLDLGVELEYENVLFDLLLQHTVQTSKHFDRADRDEENAFDTKPIFVTGPVLRVGYGLW